jgi:hypothetical protein
VFGMFGNARTRKEGKEQVWWATVGNNPTDTPAGP